MEKWVLLAISKPDERELHNLAIYPGTTVVEAIQRTGREDATTCVLADQFGNRYVPNEDFYAAAENGGKYSVLTH